MPRMDVYCTNGKSYKKKSFSGNIESEMQEMRPTFTNEQISSMASWLHNEKKNHICDNNATTSIDIAQLNDKQRLVYEIVAHHANSSEKEP